MTTRAIVGPLTFDGCRARSLLDARESFRSSWMNTSGRALAFVDTRVCIIRLSSWRRILQVSTRESSESRVKER